MEQPQKEKNYNHLKFPDGLTQTDIKLIIKQCEVQDATEDDEVLGFAQAYSEAKQMFASGEKFETITVEEWEGLILHWAELMEPQNKKGFRKVEVRFADGSEGLAPNKIPRAMHVFCQALQAQLSDGFSSEPDAWGRPPLQPVNYYKEFEEIHPFEDGNGRVGDLVWKIIMQKKHGKWPNSLPPNVFYKGPILSKIQKGALIQDKKIGAGFETEDSGGVRRKKYETDSKSFNYADRVLLGDEKEVKRVMDIYKKLKEAGLPVVSFAKSIRKKEGGKLKYYLAMEDLTEGGKFELTELHSGGKRLSPPLPEVIETAQNAEMIQQNAIRALAIMHNNNIFDFHPGLSFVLRSEINEDGNQIPTDIKIIDYPNLDSHPVPKSRQGVPPRHFEEECLGDLTELIGGLTDNFYQAHQLDLLYRKIRGSEEKTF